jgi:hypothetical protein
VPKIDEGLARDVLRKYPLGVGEHHDSDRARRFVVKLLREGRVRALFLEGDSDSQQCLNGLAKQKGEDVSGFAARCCGALHEARLPDYMKSGLFLGHVAAAAIIVNVPVYLIDTFARNYRERVDRIKSPLGKLEQTNKLGVKVRDWHACRTFKQHVANSLGGDRKGCLVLFGESHFTGENKDLWEGKQLCLADLLNLYYVLFN